MTQGLHDDARAVATRPGLAPERLARLVREAVERVSLDLTDRVVLTEAATGAYVVTSVLAALAGAEVHAWTRATSHGTIAEVRDQTEWVAHELGVWDHITIDHERSLNIASRADIVTNSGHVRPIDAALVARLKGGAVVPLMFEAWEVQAGRFDVDLAALRERGIAVAGTNERHSHVNVFSYLGLMAVKTLLDAAVPPYGTRVAVLCDNHFASYIRTGLAGAGAGVRSAATLAALAEWRTPDVLLVAMRPNGGSVLDAAAITWLARHWPETLVVQYWGDLDRAMLDSAGLAVWPLTAPAAGHMAVLPSDVGPDAIVRLQAGGLKVAEVLLRAPESRTAADWEYVDAL